MQVKGEITNKWNTFRESACKHLFKYLNPSTILPTSWKTVSFSHAYEEHTRNVCYTLPGEAKWLAYVLKKTVTTDQSWGLPGAGILEWGIENNACRLHYTVSPQLPHVFVQSFFICFFHYLGAWKRLNNRMDNTKAFWILDRKITQ